MLVNPILMETVLQIFSTTAQQIALSGPASTRLTTIKMDAKMKIEIQMMTETMYWICQTIAP